ncbi:hypothetical protein I7I50_08942 [Histoplasma capsulatum G186AR]|uniref:Uncharacterized protein n=1 Tax=Ajellomyces capsulatus TaxID=5037 RepID=A0A8H7YUS1_AJECA|nr:hypothetical protein I7I52_06458 [Histoplasma capsulatum]QSS73977.1 hypothetical protein I7I50_08942 [Histoplasma capsulatum G186AR]
MTALDEWRSGDPNICFAQYLASSRGDVRVLNCDNEVILKAGSRVRPSKEIVMRLVKDHTHIPVPEIVLAAYVSDEGRLAMSAIPSAPLIEA